MIRLTAGKRLEHQTGSGMKWNLTRLCFSEAGEFSGMTMGGGVGCVGTLGQVILSSHWSITLKLIFQTSHGNTRHRAGNMQQVDGEILREVKCPN